MSQSWGTTSPAATVENPERWNDVARAIEKSTNQPPSANLESLTAFITESIQLLIEADNSHNADLLRTHFSERVISQLVQFSGNLTGCTAKSIDLFLIGAPMATGNPIVRFRVVLTVSDPSHQLSRREQFWDIELGSVPVVTGATTCPSCGAPLGPGALVCPYCHASTQVAGQSPLLVVKFERMS